MNRAQLIRALRKTMQENGALMSLEELTALALFILVLKTQKL